MKTTTAATDDVRPSKSSRPAGSTDVTTGSSALVGMAAARAHDLADALHDLTKTRIDRAQRALTQLQVDTLWQYTQPLLLRSSAFARVYPLRTASIVALFAAAVWLMRAPTATSKRN